MNKVEEALVTYKTTDDGDILQLIESVRKGIQFAIFNKISARIPFSLTEWSSYLHLSERTFQRYKKEKKAFDPVQSEKIVEITLLYNKGTEVFGDPEKFNIWLETKNIALGGKKPKDFLDNTFGIQLLKDELFRIEHGVLA